MRSREHASKEVKAIEAKGCRCLESDVTNADACWEVFSEAQRIHGRIDVPANNALMSWLEMVEDFT